MSTGFTSGNMEFELSGARAPQPARPSDQTPFRICVLGDFSGRAGRGADAGGKPLAARRVRTVDVDNLDTLPGTLGAAVQVPVGDPAGPHATVEFNELDDFHPDRIFAKLELFQRLKDIRKRLADPATFAKAAAELGSPSAAPVAPQDQTPPAQSEADGDTLERLLGKRPETTAGAPAGRGGDVESLIREAVKPYIVPAPDPRQDELIAQVDQALSGQMRAILHHADFQKLEAAWRALQWLISEVETDETLEVSLLDVAKAELASDLAAVESPQSSGLHKLLVEQTVQTPGGAPWTLLVGNYTFDATVEDITLLTELGAVAQAAGAPLLAAGSDHLVGCESLAATPDPDNWRFAPGDEAVKAWGSLRHSGTAEYLGLTVGRFLLRLPYGAKTESIDAFDFEEMGESPEHGRYLWGHSAVICAALLAGAFREAGWSLTGALRRDVTGMPVHIHKTGGETRVVGCTEALLSERAMQRIIERGLIPALSVKGTDTVRIGRFQSIASPAKALGGRWR